MTEAEAITTARLRLEPTRQTDVARLVEIRLMPEVYHWWRGIEPGWPLEDPEITPFTIRREGVVAGFIQFSEENEPDYRHASIDMFLAPDHFGLGYGREAIAALAQWLFEARGHRRLTIDPAADNLRAVACYAAAGFVPVGRMREYERDADGAGWHDGLLMDLLVSDPR